MSIRRIFIIVALLAVFAGGIAALYQRGSAKTDAGRIREAASDPALRGTRARWAPNPEQQAILDAAALAEPDHLSDDLVSVLAAMHEQWRQLVFYGESDPEKIYLSARAWSLRDGVATGDPREVEPFVEILSQQTQPDSFGSDGSESARFRNVALVALEHAVLAGHPHRSQFGEFERLAIAHAADPEYRDNAVLLLYLLDQENGLSGAGKAVLAMWLAKEQYKDRTPHFASNIRRDFFDPG